MAGTLTRTFASLELQEIITADELIDTMRDYASSGAAVDYHVVCGIIDRVKPNEKTKNALKIWARVGIERQKALKQAAALYHYQVVLTHLTLGPRR